MSISIHNIDLQNTKSLSEKLISIRLKHILWLKLFNKQIVCKIYDKSFNVEHTDCDFGQWYCGVQNQHLINNADFKHLGSIHKELHDKAKYILNNHYNKKDISEKEYDDLIQTEVKFLYYLDIFYTEINSTISSIDALTALPNRSLFNAILKREHLKLNSNEECDCIVFADIDCFKKINDSYGHISGDKVLIKISEIFSQSLRKSDVVGRFGGEEFVIFLPKTKVAQAKIIIENLRKLINGTSFEIEQKENINITCSFGLANFSIDNELNESIANADKAMYLAKENGRNRVEVFC